MENIQFKTFSQFKNWFLAILEIGKNGFWSKWNFVKWIYLISRVFLAWTFLNFLPPCYIYNTLLVSMVSIFFAFSFFAKNENFWAILRKKRKKSHSTNFAENSNFWLVLKISGNHQKWQNFGKKWRKSIFRFSSPIFRWKTKNEKFAETKIFVFHWKP